MGKVQPSTLGPSLVPLAHAGTWESAAAASALLRVPTALGDDLVPHAPPPPPPPEAESPTHTAAAAAPTPAPPPPPPTEREIFEAKLLEKLALEAAEDAAAAAPPVDPWGLPSLVALKRMEASDSAQGLRGIAGFDTPGSISSAAPPAAAAAARSRRAAHRAEGEAGWKEWREAGDFYRERQEADRALAHQRALEELKRVDHSAYGMRLPPPKRGEVRAPYAARS